MNKLNRNTFFVLISLICLNVSCNKERIKDSNELVLSEYIIEKNGIYFEGEDELHAKIKYTGKCEFFHSNGQLKGLIYFEKGLPNGHWQYWDTSGVKAIDIFYNKGKVIKKQININK
jgi:antitoxin component YwqK of YwqJK toxin-antitoxin module